MGTENAGTRSVKEVAYAWRACAAYAAPTCCSWRAAQAVLLSSALNCSISAPCQAASPYSFKPAHLLLLAGSADHAVEQHVKLQQQGILPQQLRGAAITRELLQLA